MKKVYILMVALFLVNGVIGQSSISTLSINACAQSKHPAFDLQHPALNSMENVQGKVGNKEWNASNIVIQTKSKVPHNHQTQNQRSLIPIYDSIHNWNGVWDTGSMDWTNNYKIIEMVYDINNNLTSETYKKWNGGYWENYMRYSYVYDVNENLSIEVWQFGDSTSWCYLNLFTTTYDANNNRTNTSTQEWVFNSWRNWMLNSAIYDTSNNMTSELTQYWHDSIWMNGSHKSFTYDANNNLTVCLYLYWHDSIWINNYLNTSTYDANNNLISTLYQISINGDPWKNDGFSSYTYDANNNLTAELIQRWNGTAWVNLYQYTYTYNANNNLISKFCQQWFSNGWVNYWQTSYTYDANNFKISDSYKEWNSEATTISSGDSTYYYFHTVGINDHNQTISTLNIYPNPATDKITIKTPVKGSFSIHNISGQELIIRQITEPKTQIDISSLPSGIYFVRLSGDRTVEVGKFIKQ